jgi:hypothetical protein
MTGRHAGPPDRAFAVIVVVVVVLVVATLVCVGLTA